MASCASNGPDLAGRIVLDVGTLFHLLRGETSACTRDDMHTFLPQSSPSRGKGRKMDIWAGQIARYVQLRAAEPASIPARGLSPTLVCEVFAIVNPYGEVVQCRASRTVRTRSCLPPSGSSRRWAETSTSLDRVLAVRHALSATLGA
jgi:hypothetical protein